VSALGEVAPTTTWYLLLAVALFSIGTLGVMCAAIHS
jgi:NADH:ubiquinone oxidoreductase subunit K